MWVLLVVACVCALIRLGNTEGPFVSLNGSKYRVELALSESQQQRGLGGRDSLPANTGMLFVFQDPSVQCFWMKDMLFPIDMLWLDEDGKVLYMAERVSPDTYPETFCGEGQTKYVLELPAGTAAERSIGLGDRIPINL